MNSIEIESEPVAITIGSGALEMNLNINGLYDSVQHGRNLLAHHQKKSKADLLPFQCNLGIIQQIYLELIDNEVITVAGVEFRFTDNVWNFENLHKEGRSIRNYKFDFCKYHRRKFKLSNYYQALLKLYTLHIITEYGIDCGSNNSRFCEVKLFLKYLEENGIEDVRSIVLDNIVEFYNQHEVQYSSIVKRRRHVRDLLLFYCVLIGVDIYTTEMDEWFMDIDTETIKATIEQNKTPCLPTNFYKKYTCFLYEYVFDTNEPLFKRGLAGLLYIGSQTGLRTSELCILRASDLSVLSYNEKQIGILNYRSTKNGGKNGNIYTTGTTNASKRVIAVFNKLVELFCEVRHERKSDLLVVNIKDETNETTNGILIDFNTVLCVQNASYFDLINTDEAYLFEGNLKISSYTSLRNVKKESVIAGGAKLGDIVSYPVIRQFRVYVASDYKSRGVDDRTISYLLNHHSVEMWGYYTRTKHQVQEDIDFSSEIISEIVRDKTRIIGPKGKAYMAKIDNIINSNNLNVEQDLDTIIYKVMEEMPIRAKAGGFCIKSNPNRDCHLDGPSDEIMCAYGVCPNQCTMYFMASISYSKCQTLAKTMKYNVDAGFTNAAQKEAHKLEFIIDTELTPELDDMEKVIQEHGKEWIIQRHRSSEEIVNKLLDIREEVEKWKMNIATII